MTAEGTIVMKEEQVQVLIVGGGIVGLSAAAFLAARGTSVLLVERLAERLGSPQGQGH